MGVEFLINGTIIAQVMLYLMENCLFGYEGEHLLLFTLRITF